LSDGREVYVARRGEKGLYRDQEKTDSAAIAKGLGSWAIDEETLAKLHKRGVQLVGVLWEIHDQLFLTEITNYYDRTKFVFQDNSRRRGSAQRYLNHRYFRVLNRSVPFK